MKKKSKNTILILLIVVLIIVGFIIKIINNPEVKTVKSDKELSRIYKGDSFASDIPLKMLTLPFSLLTSVIEPLNEINTETISEPGLSINQKIYSYSSILSGLSKGESSKSESVIEETVEKDYSTTNIQVENVDEADITKTDGDYIYSISDSNVIITNVKNPEEIKIEATIKSGDGSIPEDLIIYNDKLITISSINTSSSRYSYSTQNNTIVQVYNIENKARPMFIKSYEIREPYYTSRRIDNMLYVISSGNLREDSIDDDKVERVYKEDSIEKEIPLKDINHIKDVETRRQTIISTVDLDNVKEAINVKSYLMDISNTYVSQNSIYLIYNDYQYTNVPPVSSIFGPKGIIGAFTYEDDNNLITGNKSKIIKFDIEKDGKIKYAAKTKLDGTTINQYSLDEKDGHLRVAVYTKKGSRIVVLDENLKEIGTSKYVARGEKMYSSRFIGDKAYMITFKTTDPLFVIDLSNETNPTVLGELKIPGYSTYLHPYDENHLIGIGMETETVANKNLSGKVISTSVKIIGMKMALFDVTDVNNPIQLSDVVIGDRKTTSAVLTNPKALLFSKKKKLIAIPVNDYISDFEVSDSTTEYSSMINSYKNSTKNYISEGYLVYNIDLDTGFTQKGMIMHQTMDATKTNKKYYYYGDSKLIRGMYIDNNLFTISETAIKVNDLDTMKLIEELKIVE